MKRSLPTTAHLSALLLSSLIAAQNAEASGYHFGTQSVSNQSSGNSSAAEAADPSTVFYNPAGLTKLSGTQATINLNLVIPEVKYHNGQAHYASAAHNQIMGSTSGKISDDLVVAPHFYASHQVNDRVTLGLGMFVPFGSGTDYDHDSVLRYNLNRLALQTIAIEPAVAYKFNDQHSFAVGLVAQHTTAKLRQYANFGAFTGANGIADGYAKVKGDDWGYGYNLAWLWDISKTVRVGINYRSKVDHTLKGTAQWALVGPAFANPALAGAIRHNGYAADENARVKITTPESLSLHGLWQANPKWNVFGDVTWTRHARLNELHLIYEHDKAVANPQTGGLTTSNQTILNPHWRNTLRYALGASYQYSEPLQFRFGVSYDQSPVRSAAYRLSTLPDANRIGYSVGIKYDINPDNTINLAYSYLHIQHARADVNGWCGGNASGAGSVACVSSRTSGSAAFNSHAQIIGAQYTHRF